MHRTMTVDLKSGGVGLTMIRLFVTNGLLMTLCISQTLGDDV